jgi:putative membrane protein
MATASLRDRARARPRIVTAVVSAVGYVLVIGAFAGVIPFPEIADDTVNLLADAIAVVNTVALVVLLLGVWFIRRGEVRKHRAAMLTAFGLILLFLVLYLTKVGGGFEKSIVIEDGQFLAAYSGIVRPTYLAMLAIHVLLSIVSVPVVLHAVVLGVTHQPEELRDTIHPTVGTVAVAAWSLSLALGVITYVLLNHVYSWEVSERAVLLLVLAGPGRYGAGPGDEPARGSGRGPGRSDTTARGAIAAGSGNGASHTAAGVPGFGVAGALAGLGGAGYLLRRRMREGTEHEG